jgi:hypothetical protein
MEPREALEVQQICCTLEQAATVDEEAMFRVTSVCILLDLYLLLSQNHWDSILTSKQFPILAKGGCAG